MAETGSYQETLDYLRRYAAEDWLELSVVVDWANSVTGPGSTPAEIAAMTMRFAEDLVAAGAVPGDLVSDTRDFVPWAGKATEQMGRLRSELSEMVSQGRLPEGIDVCWFHKINR
ncbi:MAG: hypothetical protein M3235_18490 [Actinomycetota bacterium]|nr:hypothetical protein [Actinomycetota bacterium]